MSLQLIDTNPETGDETPIETIIVDISGFVYPDKPHSMEWTFDNLKTTKINYLKLKISTSAPFLSDFWKKKLNPLYINIIAAKSIPAKDDGIYQPIYCVCKFNDGKEFRSIRMRQSNECKWNH
jgi:hypothetical protein